jgi:uroporphyrinogen decarboxylase
MPEQMTGRERVLAAVSFQEPDRVPLDLGGTRDSSIVVEGYERLKAHFGVSSPTELCDRMMRVVKVDEAILQAMHVDTRAIFPGGSSKGRGKELGERAFRDDWGVERFHPEGSYYYDQREAPLAGDISVSEVAHHPWPDPEDPGLVAGLRERLDWIRANTDAAAILTLPAPFVHVSQYVRGFEDWYTDFIMSTDVAEALFDAVLEVNLRIAERQLEEVGREVDIVICADDLGTQNGLQVSYEHYAKYIKPRHRRFFARVHELTPARLLFHSCGSLADILDDLAEIGVDIVNPVQVTARGMDPAELKRRYHGRLAFWGGTDSQNIVPFGTVEEVEEMVAQRIEQMARGGGYVFSSCHNIQPDVSLEKVLAMFAKARAYVPSWKR